MAIHEFTEHPDGSVEEYHEFTADEFARLTEVLPDGLGVCDLPAELRALSADDLVEFFQVAN